MNRRERELGKALCDRAGIDPLRALSEYHLQFINKSEVMVTLQVMTVITVDEFKELRDAADRRAQETDARERLAQTMEPKPKPGPVG